MELSVLKLFSNYENYTNYVDRIKDNPLSRESQWVLKNYKSWFEAKQTDIDFDTFKDYCFFGQANEIDATKKEIYSTLIDRVAALDSDVPADILHSFKVMDKSEDMIALLEEVSSGHTDPKELSDALREAAEFFSTESSEDEYELIRMDRQPEPEEDQPFFTKWKLDVLNDCSAGLTGGNLVIIMGRSNSGKTSLVVQETCARYLRLPKDKQGPVLWINNEESFEKAIENRILSYLTDKNTSVITKDIVLKNNIRAEVMEKLGEVYVCTEKDVSPGQIEKLVKELKPSSVVINNLDKVQYKKGKDDKMHSALGNLYKWARQLAKMGDTVVFALCQASADAENKHIIRQTMMQDSKTDKAGEADFIIGIGQMPQDKDAPEEPVVNGCVTRYINVCKNKLTEGSDPDKREMYGRGVAFNIHTSKYTSGELLDV